MTETPPRGLWTPYLFIWASRGQELQHFSKSKTLHWGGGSQMASSLSKVITNDMAGEQKLPCGTTKAEHIQSKWFHSRCINLFFQGLSQNLNWMCLKVDLRCQHNTRHSSSKKNTSCPAVMYVVLKRQSFSQNRKSRLDLKIDLLPQKTGLLFCKKSHSLS